MRTAALTTVLLLALAALLAAQDSAAPSGLRQEQSLPARQPYVAQDALRLCQPGKGFWVDLGAGEGQVAIPLAEATGGAVVMVDPDAEALTEGLRQAREKHLEDRLSAVVGVAEKLPFPDNSVDFVVSRGSIFFWTDPAAGLREVFRVLRPGGKAYIGGGAGRDYPKDATEKVIADRLAKLEGPEADRWRRFVELRRPEQMHEWARAAGLPKVEVMGRGAVSADDPRVGQGVWLLFEKPQPSRPNILVILADDLGYGDVQCFNPERGKIPTPSIDRLAAQGMMFTDAHSGSAVCSPTRYTLLTGRYHWRTRLQAGIVGVFGPPLIAPERLTLAGLLHTDGYRTGCIGKWHLGWDWPIPEGREGDFRLKQGEGTTEPTSDQLAVWQEVFSQPIPGGPTTRGFDTYFGTDVPNWPPYCFIENDRTLGIPSEFLDPELLKSANQASLPGPALPDWTLEPILPALAERAVGWIEEAAQRSEPFFLYLPLTSPHTPLAVAPEWQGKSGLNAYADFVMQTDAVVGQVLDALERCQLSENTLVVFTSDNGCAPYIGAEELEAKGHYPSGPWRGYKADAFEGGHRVPTIVRWPEVVAPGSRCAQTVCQVDLMATFAEIVGRSLPPTAGEDSVSLLPLLRGEDRPIHEAVVHQSASGRFAIRQGPWKLIFAAGSGGWSAPRDEAAARREGLPPMQLYNLETDPGETTNLVASEPEVVDRLTRLLEKVVADGRSTPGEPQANDVKIDIRKEPAEVSK